MSRDEGFVGFVPCPRCKRAVRVERRHIRGGKKLVFAFHTPSDEEQKWCPGSEGKVSAIDALAILNEE